MEQLLPEWSGAKEVADSYDRELWRKARQKYVCASDTPSILGADGAFGDGFTVAASKLNDLPEEGKNELFEAGHRLEEPICEWAAEEIGANLGMDGRLFRSEEYPWLACTPDAGLHAQGCQWQPLQAKLDVFGAMAGKWDDGVSPHVWVQLQHEMAVLGTEAGFAVVLLQAYKLRWKRVELDTSFRDEILLPTTEKFWQAIQEGKTPPPTAKATEVLKRMYPPENVVEGREVALSGSLIDVDERRLALAAQIRPLEKEYEGLTNEIKAGIGDAELGVLPNGVRFTYKAVAERTVVHKAGRRMSRKKAPK